MKIDLAKPSSINQYKFLLILSHYAESLKFIRKPSVCLTIKNLSAQDRQKIVLKFTTAHTLR